MSNRDAYVAKLKAQIDEWNAQLDRFEAQAKQTGENAKLSYDEQIKALHQQRELAKARFAEIQAASDEAWEDIKQGVDIAWTAFKEGLDRARSRYN